MEVFKFGFRYWKRNIPFSILAKALSLAGLTMDLLIPLLIAMVVNYCIQAGDPSMETGVFAFLLSGKYGQIHSMELFLRIAGLALLMILAKQVVIYARNVLNQYLGLNLETDLKKVSFHKLMELDTDTLADYNTGELMTILSGDTILFKEMFCRIIPNILDAVYVLIVAIILLGRIDVRLFIIPAVVTPLFAVALMEFRKRAHDNFMNIRAQNSSMALTVQENIEAVRLVRAFTNEDLERKKFDGVNQDLQQAHFKQIRLQAKFEVIFTALRMTAYIGSVAMAAFLVIRGELMLGYLVACTDYVSKIMNFVANINNNLFQMQQQIVSGQKMLDFMACESKIPEGSREVEQASPVDITIRNGSMVLDGKQVLKDINLDIPYGKKVGIVGGTGSGKSILLESLIRAHDLTGGEILLNGTDIREYDLDSLRREFSIVFQDLFLFSNTIDSNIAYAEPTVDKEMVIEAAKHARAHGFIQQMADQYDTIVGERGVGISGGQKQRVSIARALLKNAPVLVLDDSTSALDVNTERVLLREIKECYPEKTLLISAHRLSSVVDCDEILYLQDGQIIERGTFRELMELGGHFAAVYRIQEEQTKHVVDFDGLAEAQEGGAL